MKDECAGKIMTEFCGLRSKLYSVQVQGDKPTLKAKGIKKCILNTNLHSEDSESTITLNDYKRCLFDRKCKKCYSMQHSFKGSHR